MKRYLFTLLLLAAPLQADELQLDHSQGPSLDGQALAFSPDAKKLAVAGSEGVKIYESATGKLLETRAASNWEVSSVAWSPDGKSLAAAGLAFGPKPTGEIWMWRAGRQVQHWTTGNALIGSLAWSPNGKLLASASADDYDGPRNAGSALLWEAGSGKMLHILGRYKANNAAVAFTADGQKVAYSSANGSTEHLETTLCDVASGRVLKQWPTSSVPLFLDGERPLLGGALLARNVRRGVEWRIEEVDGADHMDYRFVARKMGAKRNLTAMDLGVGSGTATFGGEYLATIMLQSYFPGDESSVAIWKVAGNPPCARLVQRLGKRTLAPVKLGRSGDGKTLAFTTNRGTMVMNSQLSHFRIFPKFEGQTAFSDLAPSLSTDGKFLFDGRRIDLRKKGSIPAKSVGDFGFYNSMLSPDGRAVAGMAGLRELVGAGKKTTSQFSVPAAKQALFVKSVTWSPDSQRLAILGKSSGDGKLFLFSRTGKFQREIWTASDGITFSAAAFSPDGKWLLTAGTGALPDVRLDLWNAGTGAHRQSFKSGLQTVPEFGGEGVTTVAWSPDGRTFAASGVVRESGFTSPRAVFYDASNGKKVGDLSIPLKVAKPWVYLDARRVAVLNGNAIEVWDFQAHQREKSVFLVPGQSGVRLVSRGRVRG